MFNGSIMHTRGKSFIREHKNIDKSQTINCTLCHGYNLEGSSLSKVKDSFSSRFKYLLCISVKIRIKVIVSVSKSLRKNILCIE